MTYIMNNLIDRLTNNVKYFIGYPTACDFSYDYLSSLLNFPINNIGDAFSSNVIFSSHEYEVRVIEFMLNLYNSSIQQAWGYITSCSSESILYCLWKARNYLQTLKKNIICLASEHSHYAIPKACNVTNLPINIIKSLDNGQINLQAFENFIQDINPNATAIILVANIGTTITSAIDDIKALKLLLQKYGITFYIHADAASDGMIVPFIDDAPKFTLIKDFDSISISGHKFIGSPLPCGIMLIDKKYLEETNSIEYIDIHDHTLSGSRNGITPVILYSAIKRLGYIGLEKKAKNARNYAEKLIHHFQSLEINAWKNPYAITVVLDKLPKTLLTKWHLPSFKLYSSITALPKLTENILDEFTSDILNDRKGIPINLKGKKQYPSPIEPLI